MLLLNKALSTPLAATPGPPHVAAGFNDWRIGVMNAAMRPAALPAAEVDVPALRPCLGMDSCICAVCHKVFYATHAGVRILFISVTRGAVTTGVHVFQGTDWWAVPLEVPADAYEMHAAFSDGGNIWDKYGHKRT